MDMENTGVFDTQTDDFEQEPQEDAAFSLSEPQVSSQQNNYGGSIDDSLMRLSSDFAAEDKYTRAANIENGLAIDPIKYGKAKRIAARRGADVDLVFDNFEEFEARDKQLLLNDIVQKNPALKELATDSPEFMKLAANDCDKLQEISNNLSIYGTMDRPIKPVAVAKTAAYLYNENERRLDVYEEIGDLMTKEDAESQARLAVLVDEANKASLVDTSALSDIGYNVVEQLPYMKRTMLPKLGATVAGAAVDAAVSAKVGAAGGAAAGSVVPGAGTAAGAVVGTVGGAVTGTIKGAIVGNAVGTAIAMKNTYDVETGAMYANLAVMKDENGQGFAKDDMITVSRAYGTLSAAVELLPMETLARVIPGYNEAKKGLLKSGFKKAVQEALKNKTKTEAIRNILKNVTFAAGAEGVEESIQELLQVIGERHLQDKYNEQPGYNFEKNSWDDDVARIGEAGYQGFKASLLFPALGGAGRIYTETRAINEMQAIDSLQRGDEAKVELDNARMDNIQNTIQQLGELKENPEQVQAFLQRATRKSDIRDIYMSVEDAKLVLQSDAVKKNMDVMQKLGVLDSIQRQIANQQEIGGAIKIAFSDYGATVMSRQELYAAFKDIVKTYEDGVTMNELRQHQKTVENVVKEGQKLKEQNKADFDYIYERILENAKVAGIPSDQAKAAAEGNAYFYLGLARMHNLSAVQMFQKDGLNFDYKIENTPARSAQLDKIIDVIRDEQIKGADQNLLRASRVVARKDINAIKKTLMSKIDNPNTADVKEYLRLLNAISDMKINLESMTNEDLAGQLQTYTAQSPITVDIQRSDADRVRSGMFSASEKALSDIQDKGASGDYVLVGGGRVPVNYEIIELTDLITSHNSDGAVNEAFPQELQPRDRSRSASDAQIAEIVNNFAPERVSKSQIATEGAPIVTKEGFVAVGNGRAMAISKVYENAEKAEQYRQYLTEQGYNVENFAEPVLVRRLAIDLDSKQLQALVDDANTAGTMQYSDAEKAIAYSKKLRGEVIDLLDTDAELESAANRRFVREFFATVVPTAERNAFLDKDDKVTRKGIEMIENTLTAIIVPDARFLSVLVENPDNNIRKVTSGLAKSAPAIVAFENDIQSELVDAKYSVAADIRQAVEVLKRAKDKGQDLDLYVKQQDLLEGHIPAEVLAVADLFDKSRSAVDFADKIKSYIRNATEQGDLTQANMFGIEPVSKIELLERMNAQSGLFQLPAEAYNKQGKADVNSEAFKRWSGNSPVVSAQKAKNYSFETGKAVTVEAFHGTGYDFDTFDLGKSGKNTDNKGFYGDGIYSTNDKESAKYYAHQSAVDRLSSKIFGNMSYEKAQQIIDDNSIIMNLYVTFKNPFVWKNIKTQKEANAFSRKIGMKLEWNEGYKKINHFRNDKKSVKFTEKLIAAGYDGVIYQGDNGNEYVAFTPNQIKSVYNRGTFDPNNDNIYYQRGGRKVYSVFDLKVGDHTAIGDVQEIDNENKTIKINDKLHSMILLDSRMQYKGLSIIDKSNTPSTFLQNNIDNAAEENIKKASENRSVVEKQKLSNIEYNKKVKDYFGITNNLDLGGYILTDGDLLDLSGKKLGSDGRSRTIDHREISDAFDDFSVSMEDFINSGNIRYMPESNNLLMSDVPTAKQYKVIERIFEKANGEIRIELMSDANNWGSDKDFSREYSAGTSFSAIKRDINAFYRGEGVREITQYFQSAFAGSRVDYDAPSLEAIGTGEGNHAHGWGLYYALNRNVAEKYKDAFTAGFQSTEDYVNKRKEYYTRIRKFAKKQVKFLQENKKPEDIYFDNETVAQAIERLKNAQKLHTKRLRELNKIDINKTLGQVHEVNVPENPYLIDEQLPVNQQSEIVRKGVRDIMNKYPDDYIASENYDAGSFGDALTGKSFYKQLMFIAQRNGINDKTAQMKFASKILEENGIKGIAYDGNEDGRCFVIFNPADVKVIQKFYQQQETEALGSFTPSTLTITLFKNANLSTIIHESGHFWREMIRKYAAMDGASEQLKKYSETLENWLESEWSKHNEVIVQPDGSFTLFYNGEAIQTGFSSREAAIEVAKHECFARGIEKYFMTAEAPSFGLRKIFSTFKRWLLGVYKDAQELNVDITPEVKDVFDRLLASDGEIEQYILEKRIRQMFDTPDKANMSQKQFDRYKEYMDNMLTIAKDDYYKSLAAMAFKEKTAEFESKKSDLRHDVLMQFSDTPENRFIIALVYGKIGDTDIDIKANTAEIEKTFNRVVPDGAQRLPKRLDGTAIFAPDGMSFAELADFFGLDFDAVKKTISQSPRLITAIEDTLRYQVHENLGSPVSYAEVEAQIVKSLHNDKYFDMLSLELAKISPNPENQGAMEHALQARAEDIIGGLRITDIKPEQYFNLSLKAGDNAIAALNRGNRNAAYTYKRQQLMNFFLYKEAQKQAEFVDKAVRRLKQIGKKEVNPSVNQQHQDAARAILSRYSLANVLSQKQKERLGNLARWIDEQRAAGYDIDVPTSILEAVDKKPYTDMTVDEFSSLNDVVKNIIHNGREIKTYELAGQLLDKEKLIEKIADQFKKSYRPREIVKTGKQENHAPQDFANTVDENLVTLGGLCNRIDDGNANGIMHTTFLRPLTEAQNLENDLLRRFGNKMNELNNSLSKETKAALFENVPGAKEALGADFTLGELISVGLNMGNYYNKQRLKANFGDNKQFEQKLGWVARTLTQEHWDYIQNVWDLLDSMYPMLADHQKKMSGLDMDKVFATQVVTPYGTYRGGYYPIIYDKTAAMEARDKNNAETALLESDYGRATTAKGYTKARLDRVDAPLKFGLTPISQHVASVIHDLAYRQTIRQLWNLTNTPTFMDTFDRYLESEYRDGLCQLLKSLANQPNRDARAVKKLDGYLRIIRNRTTTIGLAYRVTTAVAQTLGFFTSVAALSQRGRKNGGKHSGTYWLWRGMKTFAQSSKNREWALANSGELRNRLNNNDVNIAEAMRGVATEISRKQKVADTMVKGGFWLIGKMDFIVAQSTWFAAYQQATQDFGYEHKDAVFYADRIMIDSQGTGNLKDTPLFQRGSELSRSMAMFYSPFAGLYQIWTQSAKDIKDKKQFAGAMSDLFTALVLPPLVEGILKGDAPGGDDDAIEWIKYLLGNPLFYWLSTLPIARDAASVMDFGRVPGSLYANAFNTVFQPVKKIYKMADGKNVKGSSFVKDVLNALAMTTGIPVGGQLADWASYDIGIMTGEIKPQSPADILYGIYRGKERK